MIERIKLFHRFFFRQFFVSIVFTKIYVLVIGAKKTYILNSIGDYFIIRVTIDGDKVKYSKKYYGK